MYVRVVGSGQYVVNDSTTTVAVTVALVATDNTPVWADTAVAMTPMRRALNCMMT